MRVTMTESRQAAPDGSRVVSLMAGTDYDLPDHLAKRYLERGLAVLPAERKAEPAAPKNKAEGPAPHNKEPSRRTRKAQG